MQQLQSSTESKININDLISAIWKHRLLVSLGIIIGLGGCYIIHIEYPEQYRSNAKLLIRYVLDRNSPDAINASNKMPEGNADRVMLTEIEILTSRFLSQQIANLLIERKLAPSYRLTDNLITDADEIHSNLEVKIGLGGNTLDVSYASKNQQYAKEILEAVIDSYLIRHLEIHRSSDAFNMIDKQVKEAAAALKKTNDALHQIRTNAGLLNLEDATNALTSLRSITNEELINAKAECAEQEARIDTLEQASKSSIEFLSDDTKIQQKIIPQDIYSEYKSITELIPFLRKRELELKLKFKPKNLIVFHNLEQLNDYEERQRSLISQYPELANPTSQLNSTSYPQWNIILEKAKLASVRAKIAIYKKNLLEITEEFASQYSIGNRIEELNRLKKIQDDDFQSLDSSLKHAKLDLTLDPSRMPNITLIETPTDAMRSHDPKTRKYMLGSVSGGLFLGVMLAIAMESRKNKKISYPHEIQKALNITPILNIPDFKNDGDKKNLISNYTDLLRDRIIPSLKQKKESKIIALVGLNHKVGTSTIALSLAESIANIQSSTVLLLNLASQESEKNSKYAQKSNNLSEILRSTKRCADIIQSQENLYYWTPEKNANSKISPTSPIYWIEFLPKILEYSYDYIIIDLPAVDETNSNIIPTNLTDKTILILDSKNTRLDKLLYAYLRLNTTDISIECVINKSHCKTS